MTNYMVGRPCNPPSINYSTQGFPAHRALQQLPLNGCARPAAGKDWAATCRAEAARCRVLTSDTPSSLPAPLTLLTEQQRWWDFKGPVQILNTQCEQNKNTTAGCHTDYRWPITAQRSSCLQSVLEELFYTTVVCWHVSVFSTVDLFWFCPCVVFALSLRLLCVFCNHFEGLFVFFVHLLYVSVVHSQVCLHICCLYEVVLFF